MRRSRTVDWLFLATLLPAWLAILGLGVRNFIAHAPWWFPFSITGAQGPAGHPIVDRLLFVDLRGYTGLAVGLRPEDVFATLNEHTERVSSVVQESGGTVVEFNGDGLMAVFGAPEVLARKEQLRPADIRVIREGRRRAR